MSIRFKPLVGAAAVIGGVAVYLIQMFVGLNDESEYSNPWYLEAARWLAAMLVVGGLAWVVAWLSMTRAHRSQG